MQTVLDQQLKKALKTEIINKIIKQLLIFCKLITEVKQVVSGMLLPVTNTWNVQHTRCNGKER